MKKFNLTLLLLSMVFPTSCYNAGIPANEQDQAPTQTEIITEPEYRKISPAEARQIMQEKDDYILLDVRTDDEFKEKRIDGAILIPDYEIGDRAEIELPDKDALILVYCRSGRRSANAADELIEMGYTNVYDFGGIIDWPYDTVSG